MRLMEEEKVSMSSYFITLTYDNDNCRITDKKWPTLVKDDLQRFFKRVRKTHNSRKGKAIILSKRYQAVRNGWKYNSLFKPLKYYAVGEYGSETFRPHYHIILFNAELELIIGKQMADAVNRGDIQLDGKLPFKSDRWLYGHITIGEVNHASVGYTLKYISKEKRIPLHKNDDRLPEFACMSKRLGRSYLSQQTLNWHKADLLNRMYVPIEDGKKIAMPRYYKDKIYSELEREQVALYNKQRICEELDLEILEAMSKGADGYALYIHNKKEGVLASYQRMYQTAKNGTSI